MHFLGCRLPYGGSRTFLLHRAYNKEKKAFTLETKCQDPLLHKRLYYKKKLCNHLTVAHTDPQGRVRGGVPPKGSDGSSCC